MKGLIVILILLSTLGSATAATLRLSFDATSVVAAPSFDPVPGPANPRVLDITIDIHNCFRYEACTSNSALFVAPIDPDPFLANIVEIEIYNWGLAPVPSVLAAPTANFDYFGLIQDVLAIGSPASVDNGQLDVEGILLPNSTRTLGTSCETPQPGCVEVMLSAEFQALAGLDRLEISEPKIGTNTFLGEWSYEVFGPLPDPIPVPAAIWLFGAALAGLWGFNRRNRAALPA